jgi:hypothetical protein
MTAELVQMPIESTKMRVRRALDEYKDAQDNWSAHALALAIELSNARKECGGNDIKFGAWLSENGCDDLGRHDRQALINIGDFIDIAREVFATTSSLSVEQIWLKEIKPQIMPGVRHDVPAAEIVESSIQVGVVEKNKPDSRNPGHRDRARDQSPLVTNDNSDDGEIAPPEVLAENILYAIGGMNENARLFHKLLKLSVLDREAVARINTAIDGMIKKWRSIQSTLDAIVRPMKIERE